MQTTSTSSPYRARTVRLDPAARDQLDKLAESSDRTFSQLVRYALNAYFALDPLPEPQQGLPEDREDPSTRHATLRLPVELDCAVSEHATKHGVTNSDVIRQAVNIWLKETNDRQLGSPTSGGAA